MELGPGLDHVRLAYRRPYYIYSGLRYYIAFQTHHDLQYIVQQEHLHSTTTINCDFIGEISDLIGISIYITSILY